VANFKKIVPVLKVSKIQEAVAFYPGVRLHGLSLRWSELTILTGGNSSLMTPTSPSSACGSVPAPLARTTTSRMLLCPNMSPLWDEVQGFAAAEFARR
jgi:hypothetical protein